MTIWRYADRVPWAAAATAFLLVLLAASLRPVPPEPEEVAGDLGKLLAKAVGRALPGEVMRQAAVDPAATGEASQLVAARLPSQVRFQLLRFREEGAQVETVLRVPLGGGGALGRPRATTQWEKDRFDLSDSETFMDGRLLVILQPFEAGDGLWYRFEIPRALFSSSGGGSWRWVLVLGLALLAAALARRAAQMTLRWRRLVDIFQVEPIRSADHDEVEALGDLGGALGRLLVDARERRINLAGFLRALQATTEQLNESLERIYTVSHEQSGGASSQAAAIQQVSTTAEEMAATARQISDNAARVTALAEETAQACEQGHSSVRDAIRGMAEVRGQVEAIAKRMTVLGANSSKIGGVIAIIDEISKQTNLLALNAAIEAAGAGEAGKRFGIVAVEVKRLADKTSNATKMIKELIHAIQEDTENTVRETELGTDAAMDGADLVKRVGDALERIAERVELTTHSAREIRVSTGQQTHASSQMAGSLGQITDVSKQIEEGTHRTVGALVDLRELSRGIQDMVNEVDIQ